MWFKLDLQKYWPLFLTRIRSILVRNDERSDHSDHELETDYLKMLSSPELSSATPSLDSSYQRMDLLCSSDDDSNGNNDNVNKINWTEDNNQINNLEEITPLTPIIWEVCPSPTGEPNYFNIPSISSLPSLPSATATPVSTNHSVRQTRKTRAKKQIAPVPKRIKRPKKFVLDYKWAKAVFLHSASVELKDGEYEDIHTDGSPLHYFNRYFSPDVVTLITEQTNLYSVQKTGKSIQLTEREFLDFVAIHVIMGIVQMPSYTDYWSARFHYNNVADIMSYIYTLLTIIWRIPIDIIKYGRWTIYERQT